MHTLSLFAFARRGSRRAGAGGRWLVPAAARAERTMSARLRGAAALIAVVAVLAAGSGALAEPRYYNDNASIPTSHPDWMKWLPDDVLVSNLSIPGTHDSGAYESYTAYTSSAVYCQGLSIA